MGYGQADEPLTKYPAAVSRLRLNFKVRYPPSMDQGRLFHALVRLHVRWGGPGALHSLKFRLCPSPERLLLTQRWDFSSSPSKWETLKKKGAVLLGTVTYRLTEVPLG